MVSDITGIGVATPFAECSSGRPVTARMKGNAAMKNRKKYFLLFLTSAAALLAIASVLVFTVKNRENIADNNRQYLIDNTGQMALLVNDSLGHGLKNIQMLSDLAGEWLASSHNGVAALQRILRNSLFDFIEFTDRDGKNHNITGGISEAGDRRYYLDAMRGNSGMELIFHSRATNETLLVFYAPAYSQGEIIGSLTGIYKERNQLDGLLTMDVFGYRAESYLCREDGTIIASNQHIDTRAQISIETVLGPRLPEGTPAGSLIYRGETAVIPLKGNETGACIMGLADSDWYVIQIFPEQATEMRVSRANQIGINSAIFLSSVLTALLILTYLILNGSMRETRQALEKAEVASKAKTDFLFSMSHDIRTPMNAIIGFARLLKKEQACLTARGREYVGRIEDASRMLLSIINNVLEMSQIEGGKAVLEETVCSAEEMIASACAQLLPEMRAKRITLATRVEVEHPFVWCDRAKLQEICLNILNNACTYTPEGGNISVRLTEIPPAREGRAWFRTEIEDTGIGIAGDFLPHVFEPFSRAQDTTHSKIAGTGLGLPIAKRLAELMGGSIEVESEQGTGTRVTVLLPHRIAAEPDGRETKTLEQAPARFSGKRLLLVEDNDFNAEVAADLLSEMGFEVERAQDGAVCVAMMERAAAGYYDLILMDTQMPNMNGYQAAETIRRMEDPSKAGTPIVAMTANTFEDDKKNAYAAGMNAHLAKPVDIPMLVKTLAEFL